MILCDIFNKCI